jgi:NMD protein affecting ribosome stability and mRNA decay
MLMGSALLTTAPRDQGQEMKMTTTNSAEVALFCTSGIVQYAESVEAMLAQYNRNGRFYEIRTNEEGEQIMWHKGHRHTAGVFKASDRA